MSSPPAASTSSLTQHFSRVFQILSSLVTWNGSKFALKINVEAKYLMSSIKSQQHDVSATKRLLYSSGYLNDPSNKNGLWGTTAIRERRSLTGTPAMFIPSTIIRPPQIGLRRNTAFRMLDFPAPVLPTIPTWFSFRQLLNLVYTNSQLSLKPTVWNCSDFSNHMVWYFLDTLMNLSRPFLKIKEARSFNSLDKKRKKIHCLDYRIITKCKRSIKLNKIWFIHLKSKH